MDLFNKKKLAALQNELDIATANLEATTKELADLQASVIESYDALTSYFEPRYKNKYFSIVHYNESKKTVIYLKCISVKYEAGTIKMEVKIAGENEHNVIDINVKDLKYLKIITKNTYLNKGEEK
jgi:hypothetical protein